MVRECYHDADIRPPDVSVYIPRLASPKRGVFLKDARGYVDRVGRDVVEQEAPPASSRRPDCD
jgi:hypothetical protein